MTWVKWLMAALAVFYVADAGRREQAAKVAMRENLAWYAREQQKTIDWLYRARWGDQ
jgi:hypothetical protein